MTGAEYWAARPKAACAMKINGEYIETAVSAYRTLEISGRHDLEADITAYETMKDGAIYRRRRQLSRTIIVRFAVKTETTEELHEALDKVNGILRTTEPMAVSFDDEVGWTYYGTHARTTIDLLLPTSAVGSIEIFCADPHKYGSEIILEASHRTPQYGFLSVNYEGTIPAAPVIEMTATSSEVGGFTAELAGATITVGDLETPDGFPTVKPETLEQTDFSRGIPGANWDATTDVIGVSNYTVAGAAAVGALSGLHPTDYGGGTEWHGPAWALSIPADSGGDTGVENFAFDYRLAAESSEGATGEIVVSMQYLNPDTEAYEVAVTVNLRKRSGAAGWRRHVALKGQYVGQADVDWDGQLDCSIYRTNGIYRIMCGRTTMSLKAGLPAPITRIQVVFAAYGSDTPVAFRLLRTQLIKIDAAGWRNIPNLFPVGTVVEIDTATGKITVDGVERPDIGNLENDYESFRLKPGMNAVTFTANDWVEAHPGYALRYREVRV